MSAMVEEDPKVEEIPDSDDDDVPTLTQGKGAVVEEEEEKGATRAKRSAVRPFPSLG